MSYGVSDLEIFSDNGANHREEVKGEQVNKMYSFGNDIDSSPTFTIDEDALNALNSKDIKNIVEIIEPASLEEKTDHDIRLTKLQRKETDEDKKQLIKSYSNSSESSSTNTHDMVPQIEVKENYSEASDTQKPIMKQPQADIIDLSAELSDKIDEVGVKTLSFGKKALALSLSLYQDKVLYNKFEKGDLVKAGDFLYLLYADELMVYKYTGNDLDLIVPDYVGDLPVKYLYKGFLSKGFVDNHKVRGFLSYFKEDNILDLSADNLVSASHGIKSIQLPINLVHIPQNAFSGCGRLKTIVIPPSVKIISPRAFYASGISNIYFQGSAPRNCEALKLNLGMNIYCSPEHVKSYAGLIKEAQKFILEYKDFKIQQDTDMKEEMERIKSVGCS